MKHRTQEEKELTRHSAYRWMKTIAEVLAIAFLVWCSVFLATSHADAWEPNTWDAEGSVTDAYIICQPGDYINVREKPGMKAEVIAMFDPGDRFWTDGKTRNGFLHVVNMAAEIVEGWVSERYVVYDKPEEINRRAVVNSQYKLAARKYIGGKVRKWLKKGDAVTVFWYSEEWCVTNIGFVKTEYLELEGE